MLLKIVHIYWFLISEHWSFDTEDHPDVGFYEDLDGHASRKKETLGRMFFSPLTRKRIFLLSCVAVSIDPLFFYIPIIDEKDKCLAIDKNLRTAALIFRALPDATFALRTTISGHTIYKDEADDSLGILTRTYICSIIGFVGILIAVSLILPIPQVRDPNFNSCCLFLLPVISNLLLLMWNNVEYHYYKK